MKRTVIVLTVLLALLVSTVQASAAPTAGTPNCVGTYLVVENSDVQSLWTLSRDGTTQVTSSAEDAVPSFSHQQGAWRRVPSGPVNVTTLDFPVDGTYAPTTVARVDAVLAFSNACQDVSGSLELRTYAVPAEDPLDPSAGTFVLSETFTGRLVTAH